MEVYLNWLTYFLTGYITSCGTCRHRGRGGVCRRFPPAQLQSKVIGGLYYPSISQPTKVTAMDMCWEWKPSKEVKRGA